MGKSDDLFKYREEVESIFDEFNKVVPLSKDSAWQFLYRSLLWLEKINDEYVPHLRETNDLKKPVWLGRSQSFRQYLEATLEPAEILLLDRVDMLYKNRVM